MSRTTFERILLLLVAALLIAWGLAPSTAHAASEKAYDSVHVLTVHIAHATPGLGGSWSAVPNPGYVRTMVIPLFLRGSMSDSLFFSYSAAGWQVHPLTHVTTRALVPPTAVATSVGSTVEGFATAIIRSDDEAAFAYLTTVKRVQAHNVSLDIMLGLRVHPSGYTYTIDTQGASCARVTITFSFPDARAAVSDQVELIPTLAGWKIDQIQVS
jgi:hypothetical protein